MTDARDTTGQAPDPTAARDADRPAPMRPSRPVLLGIGASAGGLEAFQEVLGALEPGDRMALILIQHLDPDQESLLPELLSRRSPLPVRSISDGMPVEGGQVYLIPPAYGLRVEGGRLWLRRFEEPRGQRRPIDDFLNSLAVAEGPNAAAVVLSGTGSDGALGARAVKEAGGVVLVQEPTEARYDGMPRAAIATGAVDMVLPASEMVPVLRDFHARTLGLAPQLGTDPAFVAKVVRTLRHRIGHDFSGYKLGTLVRRIALRMSVLGLSDPGDYLRELVRDRTEADRLFRDLLVNVTRFLRDPPAFEALAERVIPDLLQGRGAGDELRVWVPGCSTGQEAYGIAMLMAAALERSDSRPRLSVFGTDIDEQALAVARRGEYPSSIASELPAHLLDRWFTGTTGGYEVRPELRDMVRFSMHSVIKDPPFSRLDLITCRNLLIYFDHDLQDLCTRVFAYALSPGGYLMLGPSETLRHPGEWFASVAPEHRISLRTVAPAGAPDLPRRLLAQGGAEADRPGFDGGPGIPGAEAAVRALLARHAPPWLLIGPDDSVVEVGPGAEDYLRPPSGRASLGARGLIRPDLAPALKRLLSTVAPGGTGYRRIDLAEAEGLPVPLTIGAEALADSTLRLVTIAPAGSGSRPADDPSRIVVDEVYVSRIEDELEKARETIRTTVEELETSNEELKSSNEEMMSMNEELQSANEELSTTNDELQGKVRELAEVNADLANFMESTQIATVFLDGTLRVRNFTPEAVAWFRFVEQDRGREILDIGTRLDMERLVEICRRVSETARPEEHTFSTADGKAEAMVRFAPYRAEAAAPGGVVFSVFDITTVTRTARALEQASAAARDSAQEIEELYAVSPGAMGMVDRDLRFIRVNPRLAEINGRPAAGHGGLSLSEVLPELAGRVIPLIRQVFETGEPVLGTVVRGTTPGHAGEERVWEVDWYPVHRNGAVHAVGFNVNDVTRLLALQADLRRIMRELQHRVKNMLSNVIALVNRARREDGDPATILGTLSQRIRALANTHNLLTAENWASTSINDILAMELVEVYGPDRVTTRGPMMRLNARATLAIGMAVHELATNAAKYGAFSTAEGQVAVRWSRTDEGEGERLVMIWTESGGPGVSQPDREGFGTQLIRSMIEGTLGGSIAANWEPAGLNLVLVLPWDAATEVDYDSDVDPLRHADPLP